MTTARLRACFACVRWLPALVLSLQAIPAMAQGPAETALLDAMFQEHAVLQRDRPIRIWGRARPGATVQVRLGAQHARARVDRGGAWEVVLPALPAGGPHTLTASEGTRTQSVADVLMGDVWLCSGQSNMELGVWRTLDAASELADVSAPTIRLFTVPQSASPVPRDAFDAAVAWQTVDADTLREFSATCFYFARELQKTVDVPMGLIDASWGGSRIEAWIDGDWLRTESRYREPLDVLRLHADDPQAAAERWGRLWSRWWAQRAGTSAGDRPWLDAGASMAAWPQAPRDLGPWEDWGEPALADFNGMVWYRTTVALTPEQAARGALLELGAIDETDTTWVNGVAVGSRYDPGSPRRYPLAAGLLRTGGNSVVVNVLDTYRDGGMRAPASAYRIAFDDGSYVTLGRWRYRQVPGGAFPPGAPWQSAGGLSTLYNGMIAPLGRHGLRGILWYQGESNTGEAADYRDLLAGLATAWRARFGKGLPMLVVQLAGYGTPPTAPGDSDWADVREAQRQVADADPDTALAIALDIGERDDLHPPNKQALGRRLARAARRLVYGEDITASGPVPVSVARIDDSIVVRFGDVDGSLVAYGAAGPVGFELCGDAAGSCRYADARIQGRDVVLRPAVATTTRVRYGWADHPVVNLFDGAGLPAGPFEFPVP